MFYTFICYDTHNKNAISERYQLVKEKSGIKIGDGSCYLQVFVLGREAASLEKCAEEVADNPSCGNAFFFRENKKYIRGKYVNIFNFNNQYKNYFYIQKY